jgi:protein-tyrosine phosphatase
MSLLFSLPTGFFIILLSLEGMAATSCGCKIGASLKRLLFLCTGNYYRSRYAEILFNAKASAIRLAWRANSRGLDFTAGKNNVGPLSLFVADRLKRRGFGLVASPRMPQQVSASDFAGADLVIALNEAEHRPILVARFAEWVHRVEYWHVYDTDRAEPNEALSNVKSKSFSPGKCHTLSRVFKRSRGLHCISFIERGLWADKIALIRRKWREVTFMPHDHKYSIADDEAVHVLLDKMLGGGTQQKRREKLLKALEQASRRYTNSSQMERQAFFHGLLTGYAVALKLW